MAVIAIIGRDVRLPLSNGRMTRREPADGTHQWFVLRLQGVPETSRYWFLILSRCLALIWKDNVIEIWINYPFHNGI
jgi:hypothetical protein